MQTLNKTQMDQLLGQLAQNYNVLVPADYHGLSQYTPYEQVTDGEAVIVLDKNTTVPPKTLFLPQTEAVYKFKAQGQNLAIEQLSADKTEQVVFPMRHCDVKGIQCLDQVFMGKEYVDPQYQDKRQKTTIFAIRCNEPKPTCFCTSMGVDPVQAEASVADVEVYDLGDKFAFEAISPKGEKILQTLQGLLKEEMVTLPPVKERMLQIKTDGLPEKLSGMFDDPIWNDFMFKCLGCGTCTYICPTCHCFDLNNKIRGEVGLKLRTWDSCMFDEYTLMAGGHQPRAGKKERIRNRFLHKLQYFNEKHGMFLCVGCGRCLNKCPMNIDITKFVQRVTENV